MLCYALFVLQVRHVSPTPLTLAMLCRMAFWATGIHKSDCWAERHESPTPFPPLQCCADACVPAHRVKTTATTSGFFLLWHGGPCVLGLRSLASSQGNWWQHCNGGAGGGYSRQSAATPMQDTATLKCLILVLKLSCNSSSGGQHCLASMESVA